MPVNSVSEAKREVDKPRFSLSLNRNATYLIKGKAELKGESAEISKSSKTSDKNNKENQPLKRPLTSTYLNTLHAAKRLKPLSETSIVPAKTFEQRKTSVDLRISSHGSAMLNGHHTSDSQYGNPPKKMPIATLSNLGNTCFLNSVLYTLRYAPRFLHNLHHLVSDLASVEQKLGSIRLKSSSLGRSAAGLASSGARSWSSKDLLSLGQSDNSSGKSKIQIATEKLHETYLSLRAGEARAAGGGSGAGGGGGGGGGDPAPDPYAPDAFLAALRDVNSTFEGNRQQDAHELLVCILDNIRETCRALSAKASRLQLQENGDRNTNGYNKINKLKNSVSSPSSNGINRQPSLDSDSGKATLGNLRKSWKKRREVKESKDKDKRCSPIDERSPSPAPADERHRPGWDFVADDFEGTMVVRTTCMECEAVREKAQAVCELSVPVGDDLIGDEPFKDAVRTTEHLRDQNKYWCEQCLRYNEARRSVTYSRLPRLLVLQLKRFSGGMEKLTRHAPTPLLMPCFCEPCTKRPPNHPPHHKYVLWAVIMHLGQSLTGGHYVAYARAGGTDFANGTDGPDAASTDGTDAACYRDSAPDAQPTHTTSSFMRTLFNRPRHTNTGCLARECCVPRPRPDSCWLACDDELVKPISNEEFEDLLSSEPRLRSAATPYLLFYVKSEVG